MAEVMKRAGRAGTVVGTLLRTAAVSHSTCTTSVLQREDVGSTSSPRIENLRELATAAVCAAFGAAAVSTSCNEPVRAEQAGDSNQSSEKTGGTGITPMLQLIDTILSNPDDNTQISLVYVNVTPEDILLKEKLDLLAQAHPNFKVYYVVDKPTEKWKGGAGFINKATIVKALPSPDGDTIMLVCGPPGLMNHISGDKAKDNSQGELSGLLKEAGYTKDQVYKF